MRVAPGIYNAVLQCGCTGRVCGRLFFGCEADDPTAARLQAVLIPGFFKDTVVETAVSEIILTGSRLAGLMASWLRSSPYAERGGDWT